MDRGAWWATVLRVTKAGHNLATDPPPTTQIQFFFLHVEYK